MLNYNLKDTIIKDSPNPSGYPIAGVGMPLDLLVPTDFPTGGVKPALPINDFIDPLIKNVNNVDDLVDNAVDVIGSAVGVPMLGDLLSAIGIGPDDWADVEARFQRDYIQPTIQKINSILSSVTKDNALQVLTDLDRWIGFMSSTERYRIKGYNSSNSKNSAELIAKTFDTVKGKIRTQYAKAFNTVSKSSSNFSQFNYLDARGHSNRTTNGAVQYLEYVSAKKSVVPVATVTTNQGGAKPTYTATSTSSSYEFKMWHLLLIPVFPIVYFGYKWIKNKK